MPTPLICTLTASVIFFLLALWNMRSMMQVGLMSFSNIDKQMGRHVVFGGLFALNALASGIMLIIWLVKGTL